MYVSPELTHLVGAKLKPDTTKQFELLIQIVNSGVLSSYPDERVWRNLAYTRPLSWTDGEFFGLAKACFCDIPFTELAIHVGKYGEFGLAFQKDFLVQQGASPVFYVATNAQLESTALGDHVKENFNNLVNLSDIRGGTTINQQLSHFVVTRLAAYVKAFDAKRRDDDPLNYYMEREWRVHGGVRFSVGDISTIVLPTKYKKEFRKRVPAFRGKFVDAGFGAARGSRGRETG